VERNLDYVRKVQEDTNGYIREILSQTQQLRTVAASLQAEKELLEQEVSQLRAELDSQRINSQQLERQIEQISRANQEALDRYHTVAAQNASLANLYVATYQLHETVDREAVLRGIREVIANLIGCEEVAIFEVDGPFLRLARSFGMEPPREAVPVGHGAIGAAARNGEIFVAAVDKPDPRSPEERDLSACVPLKVDGTVIGAVALFRLLPQKYEGFTALDWELLNLLATHGATALYCTQLLAAQRLQA
jgi:regulator of replication initiation timing